MTSPRTPLEDALRELIRVSKGAGMNAASDFGYMPSQQQADEEEISEAVQAVYAAIEREASCHRCEGKGWIDNSHDQADPHARPTCSCCAGTGKERHR